MSQSITVAMVQLAPIWLNKSATLKIKDNEKQDGDQKHD